MQKINTFLWFDSQAEDAAKYYVSIFEKDSRIVHVSRYTEAGHEVHGQKAGSVMTVEFQLSGCTLTALNGGPLFKFTEAISLEVHCEDQKEVDYFWEKLGAGGDPKAQQCGWLKDKFGVSWQIVPAVMASMIGDPDDAKASRVMTALLKMKKLDIAQLEQAHAGK